MESGILLMAALIGLQGISVVVGIALRRRFGWRPFVCLTAGFGALPFLAFGLSALRYPSLEYLLPLALVVLFEALQLLAVYVSKRRSGPSPP
jgi:hypothetical protein